MSLQNIFFAFNFGWIERFIKPKVVNFVAQWLESIFFVVVFYFFFSPSRLMTSCLGSIQWRWLQLTLFLVATHFLLMLHDYYVLPRRLSASQFSLSFFNSHPSNRVFYSFFTLRAWDQVLFIFERPPTRPWSFTGVGLFYPFPIRSINCFELAPGFGPSPFQVNTLRSEY